MHLQFIAASAHEKSDLSPVAGGQGDSGDATMITTSCLVVWTVECMMYLLTF